jgi:hypothetical protein
MRTSSAEGSRRQSDPAHPVAARDRHAVVRPAPATGGHRSRCQGVPVANLNAVNGIVRKLLGDGVAASSRFDPQAKRVGEWLHSRYVDIPEELW